jgi:Flp pilus assembly pilin Flp
MILRSGKPRVLERGQGLVEYALALVLVAIIVIIILGIAGESIQRQYCQIVYTFDPSADAPFCEAIDVSCVIQTESPFRMEAVVTDNAGDNNITEVKFYVDSLLYNTENHYHYCLEYGDSALCVPYSGTSGEHEFQAVARDADGNTGTCSLTATVP